MPTAAESTTELGPIAADRIKAELGQVASDGRNVSLYVHIPFCKSMCSYCSGDVIPTRDESRGEAYVDQLATEMTLVTGSLLTAKVTEITLGGGSPNFLAPRTLRLLISAIQRYFAIAPDARRSIGLDPRSTTVVQIETLSDLGFTSMSLGVQDFAQPVQDAIRRQQSVAQTRLLVERARSYDFDDINVDVVYGLPLQTETSFASTLQSVIELDADRIALVVEKAGRIHDSYERATLLLMAIDQLAAAGYIHLGFDHFARPGSRLARAAAGGRMTRTVQGYSDGRAESVIGVGTSAISSTPRLQWQNYVGLKEWEAAIADGRLPVQRGFVLAGDDDMVFDRYPQGVAEAPRNSSTI